VIVDMTLVVLSHVQAKTLLHAREQNERGVTSSLDLGVTSSQVRLDESGVLLREDTLLRWDQVERIRDEEGLCFRASDGEVEPIRGFSEQTQRIHQLYPTQSAPALLISGFTMHRIRDVTPERGAREMVKALGRVHGRVLDTTTGLGYAAIEAAKDATEVITIELDPVAQHMAQLNPWSQPLFTQQNISQLMGNSAELVPQFPEQHFSCVIHDPPAINLAGDLYAESFYRALHRVLQKGGRLFHYIGDPHSSSGARVTKGVKQRLAEAGFSKIVPKPEAFGLLAYK
jgi:predicted methyltransferase